MIKLKEAIELYRKEKGQISNTYDWFRKSAARDGFITIGKNKIKAIKKNGIWYVAETEFDDSITLQRLTQKEIKQNTDDHKRNIIHGLNVKIETNWGYYINYEDFRLVVNLTDVFKGKSYGIWICNSCNQIAQLEHKKEECHLCSDWNGCGEDCTLSLVFCERCKTDFIR